MIKTYHKTTAKYDKDDFVLESTYNFHLKIFGITIKKRTSITENEIQKNNCDNNVGFTKK